MHMHAYILKCTFDLLYWVSEGLQICSTSNLQFNKKTIFGGKKNVILTLAYRECRAAAPGLNSACRAPRLDVQNPGFDRSCV